MSVHGSAVDTVVDPVAVTGLSRSFGDVHALAGVDLRIRPGEVVAVLGPNGAGKTTLLEILLGLQRADRGSAALFGLPPARALRAGRVGAMLQSGGLLPDVTVAELIRLTSACYPKKMDFDAVIAGSGLTGLESRRTNALSGGQVQRVRLALALASDPQLLILDEPTVAMDVTARRDFWRDQVAAAQAGHTLLFATHYLEEAEAFADRVVILARGRVIADDTAAAVKKLVAARWVRFTLPNADHTTLHAIPGVVEVGGHGAAVALRCADADTALRHVIGQYPDARDFEVRGADLEDAFLTMIGDDA